MAAVLSFPVSPVLAQPGSEVGEGFQRVPTWTLLEFDDQVQDSHGRFYPVPLEQVGLQVQPHMLARRIARRSFGGY